jgi:hypothetical protein
VRRVALNGPGSCFQPATEPGEESDKRFEAYRREIASACSYCGPRACGREFDSRSLHHPTKAGTLSGLFCAQKNPNSHRGLRIPLKGATPG